MTIWFRASVLLLTVFIARGVGAQPGPAPGAAPSAAQETARTAPELRPGIPGLKMADVRDHEHLWREIDELQIWERGDRISIAEYRSKAIDKTAAFLGLSGAAASEFTAAAAGAVAAIRESFAADRQSDRDPSDPQARFAADLNAAVARVTVLLRQEPRRELFAPRCKEWLLRLAFGPSEAKEGREAKRAQADDKPAQPR